MAVTRSAPDSADTCYQVPDDWSTEVTQFPVVYLWVRLAGRLPDGSGFDVPESQFDPVGAGARRAGLRGRGVCGRPGQFSGRGSGRVGVRHLQGQGAVPACRPRADDAGVVVQSLSGAVHPAGRCGVRSSLSAALREHGEGERAIEEDDLATAFYENDTIDLGQLMREQFYLGLPMKPLCGEECRGLCPVCGTNLTRGACECRRDWNDPRLAPLQALRDRQRDGH